MNIYYINDLHLDQRLNLKKNKQQKINDFISELLINCDENDTKNSLLIISGDFSNYSSHTIYFLNQISQYFDQIAIVFGNHDYYLIDYHHAAKYKFDSIQKINECYKEIKNINNIHVLGEEFDHILNYKNLKIGGTTLFSNPYFNDKTTFFYKNFMADFKYIYIDNNIKDINEKQVKYYNQLNNENLNIFVSHFPIITTHSHTIDNRLNDGSHSSFKTIVDEIIAPINFFGHVHERNSYKIADCRFYTNCAGYKGEYENCEIKKIKY